MSKFNYDFAPHSFVPFKDRKVLEYCRNIKREDMEKHSNPDFKIKIVADPASILVADMFTRIKVSDEQDQKLVMILPNPWPSAYSNVAELCNVYGVSTRNLHTFNMDDWADDLGNVAPINYKAGLGYAFKRTFFDKLEGISRMPEENMHYVTTENVNDYSKMIEDIGEGGADICYSATGWPGHTAFIDPDTTEFAANSLDEFLELGSRIVTQHPLTIAENSLFEIFGCSGDVAAVPPRAATIGPRDIKNARDHLELHSLTEMGGITSWQRMISRLTLYAPVNMQIPSTIHQLFKARVYVSEAIAQPFAFNTY